MAILGTGITLNLDYRTYKVLWSSSKMYSNFTVVLNEFEEQNNTYTLTNKTYSPGGISELCFSYIFPNLHIRYFELFKPKLTNIWVIHKCVIV